MKPDLRPVRRSTLSTAVADQIRDLIATGRLQPGDRLPPERELGEHLSVGRSTIREALGALVAMGVVHRARGGLFVNPKPVPLPGVTSLSTIAEIFEARRLFELDLASLAASRAADDDLTEIGRWLPPRGRVPDLDTFKTMDVAFHGAVARAAHNRVVVELFEAVRGILFRSHSYYTALDSFGADEARSVLRSILADHARIYKAIAEHKPARARDAMETHFKRLEEWLVPRLPAEAGSEAEPRP